MSERFTKLFTAPENLYAATSPVIITAGALLKDNQTGKVLAQLKMRNIGAKTIKAATVLIHSFDTVGDPLGRELTYQYLDLAAAQGQDFGAKTPIPLADAATRSFSVAVKEIFFADNTTWTAADELWEPLPAPVTLEDSLSDAELVKQYRIQYGTDCQYMPTAQRDLWRCTCGEWSRRGTDTCCHCGKSLPVLMAVDLTKLRAERDARLAAEAETAATKKAAAATRMKKAKKVAVIVAALLAAGVAAYFAVTKVVIPNGKYNDAVALMEAGQYTEAIAAFEAMDGYKDSAEQIEACNTAILDEQYDAAVALMEAKQYEDAAAIFKSLGGYKDSAERLKACQKPALKGAKVGSYVLFGEYEQDNDTSNGKEAIEWLVLDIQDGKALLISKYALDSKPYNKTMGTVTWENCWLRRWLNSSFLDAAFSEAEQAMIPTVTVSAEKNPRCNTDPGNATQDQVFLLSIAEASRYFTSDSARQCKATDYAIRQGVNTTSGSCWQWLRVPGQQQNYVARIHEDGYIIWEGIPAFMEEGAVRPVIWVDLGA